MIGFISVAILLLFGIILMVGKKDDVEIHHKLNLGYGFFLILFAGCRLAFIMAVWYPDEPWSPDSYSFIVIIGYLLTTLGLTSIINVIESYLLRKTKHAFTVLGALLSVLYFLGVLGIITQNLALTISWFSSPVLIAVVVILYLYLAVKSTAEIRKKSALILVAIFLLAIGTVIDGESIITSAPEWFTYDTTLLEVFYSIAPTVIIVGVIVFFKVTC